MKISVAVITYNEEKNIYDCIHSFYDFADEVIILDSFSTDKTEEICKSFPKVKFYQQKFIGHVEQKNSALKLCKNNWVLSLDADERVSEDLKISLLACKENSEIAGYKISRLTYHLGRYIRYCGWYPNYRHRLVHKEKAKWQGENPHDYLSVNGKSSKLKGDIIHYSFQDLSHQINTINQFSSIVSLSRFQKKVRFALLKMLLKPISKFLEIYIFKLGFLDAWAGFVIAYSSAFSTFLKFAKLYELQKKYIERPSNLRKDYGNKENKNKI